MVAGADRLVLLGDVLECRHGPLPDALRAAGPPLSALGRALPAGATVILTAGNHDHHLLEPWLDTRTPTPPLGTAGEVPVTPGTPLATIVDQLGATRTTVTYPGVWLRDDVWATHGHFADPHTTVPMSERLAAGAMSRLLRIGPDGPRRAEDYEAILGPIYGWLDGLARGGRPGEGASAAAWRKLGGAGSGAERRPLRWRAATVAVPVVIAAINRAGLGPLRADLSGPALRDAALAAMGEMAGRLGAEAAGARHIIFGHTHRAGPLAADAPDLWTTPAGARLINCGCWVRETGFLGADPSSSPYRAGFAVWVDSDPARAPELVNLLD